MGLYRVINMGVPVVIGVCQQASSPPPAEKTLSIRAVNTATVAYGSIIGGDPEPQAIPVGERLTATLNSDNSFTFGADTLAQFYSGSNTNEQVFTAFQITYTADNFDRNDMPDNGSCFVQWTLNNFNNNSSPLNHAGIWPVQGNDAGLILPQGKIAGIQWINSSGINQSESFETTPVAGDVLSGAVGINTLLIDGEGGTNNNNTDKLNKVPLAAQKLGGGTTTFTLSLRITLKDGTFATGSQIITVPENAIKENIVSGGATPTVLRVRTQALLSSPFESTVPNSNLPLEEQLISIMDGGNGFTAGNTTMIFQTGGTTSASHSFAVQFDTSGLNIADFNEIMQLRYVITSAGFGASEIGFLLDGDEEFNQTISLPVPREEIITGEDVQGPILIVDNNNQFKITPDLNGEQWSIRVELQKSDGSFVVSPDQVIQMSANTVVDL